MTRTGIVGGTFDTLHDGHRALLNKTFEEGDHVIVGITTDEKANASREREVNILDVRRDSVESLCKSLENIHDTTFEIAEIDDNYKRAIESGADYIVLSPERKTHERAMKINKERVENGKHPLQIIEAPMVTDYKDRKISATRIRKNEITEHGEKR